MKVLFATTNPSKVQRFKEELEKRNIELISLNDLNIKLNIDENGKNAIENAYIKAKAYYEKTKIPTIGMDDNLFIEELPEERQPGTHVRRVNGKELNDEEMIEYYTNLVKEYGGRLTSKWVYGMVFYDEKGARKYTWSRNSMYLVDKVSEKRDERYPLNSISIVPEYNKYLVDLTKEEKMEINKKCNEDGVIEFIVNSVNK